MVGPGSGLEKIGTQFKAEQIGDFFLISKYFGSVQKRLKESSIVAETHIDFLEFGKEEGMVRGQILFINGFIFEFMEYLSEDKRLKYRFHFSTEKGELVFRYDNAPHHPEIQSFPHHKHLKRKAVLSSEVSFAETFDEAEKLILRE